MDLKKEIISLLRIKTDDEKIKKKIIKAKEELGVVFFILKNNYSQEKTDEILCKNYLKLKTVNIEERILIIKKLFQYV